MVLFKEALYTALNSVKSIKQFEEVDYDNMLNRVLAKDIICTKDLPTFNNSAMDGYAFKYKDIKNSLKVAATIYAGDNQDAILKDNECYKIMTGAKVPADADTIAPKEICEVDSNYIKVQKDINKGNAIRLKGEEQKKGTVLLEKGTILTPAKIALLASQGISKVEVFKKIKIAILSTGSELKEPWEEATEDEVYNINAINIKMHLKQYGLDSTYLGSIEDNLNKSIKFLSKLKEYNVVITTGGISSGDADFTKEAFIKNGLKELFHGIKVKPGHPTLMGIMDNTFVMAMPGNPLAAILNILLLSMPILFKIQGAKDIFYETITVKNSKDLKLKANRVNIVLGNLIYNKFSAFKDNKYGSGMITPLTNSRYIALFGEDKSLIKANEEIKVIRLNSAICSDKFDYIN